MRFLVVDDHAPDRRRVTRVRQDEHQLDEAATLAEALRRIDESEEPLGQYDAVLLDLDLPDSTGAATYYRMRQRVSPVPIVIYSRTQDLDVARALMRDGAAEYILKRAGLAGEVVLFILQVAAYQVRHPHGASMDRAELFERAQESNRRVRSAVSSAPPSIRQAVEERIAEFEQLLSELTEETRRRDEEHDADITQNRLEAQTAAQAAAALARRTEKVEEHIAAFTDLPKDEQKRVTAKHKALGGIAILVLQALGVLLRTLLEGGSPW